MPRGHALIVDDSSTARIILARMLEKADFTARGAASAEEGFKMLRAESYDLIFLDHLLPGMNGFDALKILKDDPDTRDIPVFMYTSQNADKYLEDAKALGAAGVISKQVDRDQLLEMVDSILAGRDDDIPLLPLPKEPLNGTDEASVSRRLTGRLSTLEIAYEDTHDELHQLRTTVATLQAQIEESVDRRYRRLRLLWSVTLVGLVAVAVYFSLELAQVKQVLNSVNEQFTVIQDIIAQIVGIDGQGQ
ncbi:response regulator [Marinobacter sp. NFXS9]|uniref:response regulator n=1 Tax=Marinobacter sp. NFXS9 TaxID=2818433 RepID=UPI0032E038B1